MPTWAYPFIVFAVALVLVPVLFQAWVERVRAQRLRHTEAMLAELAQAKAKPEALEADGHGEKDGARE